MTKGFREMGKDDEHFYMRHMSPLSNAATGDFLEWVRVHRPDITSFELMDPEEIALLYAQYKSAQNK
jgi:hypothetical protein